MQIKNRIHTIVLFFILFVLQSFCITSIAQPVTGVHTFAPSSVLAEGKWVRIAISSTGVYQITYAELQKMGFSDPSHVGVYGFGGQLLDESFATPHIDDLPEIAIYHDASRKRLLFYGVGLISWKVDKNRSFYHTNHPYANQACYFLHQKTDTPKSLEKVTSATEGEVCTSFDDYFVHELDEISVAKSGRELYGESFLYTQTQDFSFNIPGLISEDKNASIEVDFIAKTQNQIGELQLSLNGVTLSNSRVPTLSDKYTMALNVNAKTSFTPDGSEKQKVRLTFKPNGGMLNLAYLNYIRFNVKRQLQLYDSFTLFRNTKAQNEVLKYIIGNNASDPIRVWNVTNSLNVKEQELTTFEQGWGFVPQSIGLEEYALVNTNATFPSVSFVETVANQNLHASEQTQMVILVQPKLRAQAERLASYRREKDGLSVLIVTPQTVYNEFSSGTPDITAVRLFMKMFYDRSQTMGTAPQYLLLFGDGAYDNRGKNSAQWKPSVIENFLLTYQSESSLTETDSYVCDDYYGFLDDNEGGRKDAYGKYTLEYDYLDLGIGRLPVRTVDEAKGVVDKILNYSDNKILGTWKNNLCFFGDDGDNNLHMSHADSMVMLMKKEGHQEFIYNKIFLDAYKQEKSASGKDYPLAKQKLSDLFQKGLLLFNYSGHGSNTSLTHEKFFMVADCENLQMKRLPVFVTATCDFSRFDESVTSSGETLLLNPNGGGIALFTTTRIVYANQNMMINNCLIRNLFTKQADGTRYRMGDVIKLSKRELGNQRNKLNFTLLGDPSMKMAYPEYQMEITEVNGNAVQKDKVVQLKALSKVTMKGRVLDLGSTDQVATDFNGLIYPSVFDCEDSVTCLDNEKNGDPFVYTNRSKKVFNGCDSVRNGEFSFSFIVPQDISYSSKTGMVNLYACDINNREAQGYFETFTLNGTESEVQEDVEAPLIESLYLNDESFKSGDVVNATPYLFATIQDNVGINTSGISIGHDLVATIRSNDKTIKYILNDYFLVNVGESTRGSVKFSIPTLEDGDYVLELKVWDVSNNASTKEIAFKVSNSVKPQLFDLITLQNPAREEAQFALIHNRPESKLKVRIQVYTQMGQCVWDHQTDALSDYDEKTIITWNLMNSSGGRVLPGIYIYRASISTDGDHFATKSRKLIVLEH